MNRPRYPFCLNSYRVFIKPAVRACYLHKYIVKHGTVAKKYV